MFSVRPLTNGYIQPHDIAPVLKSEIFENFEFFFNLKIPGVILPKIISLALGALTPINYILCIHWLQIDEKQQMVVILLIEKQKWSGCKTDHCLPARLW